MKANQLDINFLILKLSIYMIQSKVEESENLEREREITSMVECQDQQKIVVLLGFYIFHALPEKHDKVETIYE